MTQERDDPLAQPLDWRGFPVLPITQGSFLNHKQVLTCFCRQLEFKPALLHALAEVGGSESVTSEHLMEAIQYRTLDRQLWGM